MKIASRVCKLRAPSAREMLRALSAKRQERAAAACKSFWPIGIARRALGWAQYVGGSVSRSMDMGERCRNYFENPRCQDRFWLAFLGRTSSKTAERPGGIVAWRFVASPACGLEAGRFKGRVKVQRDRFRRRSRQLLGGGGNAYRQARRPGGCTASKRRSTAPSGACHGGAGTQHRGGRRLAPLTSRNTAPQLR